MDTGNNNNCIKPADIRTLLAWENIDIKEINAQREDLIKKLSLTFIDYNSGNKENINNADDEFADLDDLFLQQYTRGKEVERKVVNLLEIVRKKMKDSNNQRAEEWLTYLRSIVL